MQMKLGNKEGHFSGSLSADERFWTPW